MKILCSGNPNQHTIAQAIKEIYPETAFLFRSNGYDFTKDSGLERFENALPNYNIFINSSYIAPGIQLKLLETAWRMWMQADIRGHVISIGTTAELNFDLKNKNYIESKIALKNRSLELHKQTGITGVKTSYIILGGLNNNQKGSEEYPTTGSVARAIDWLIHYQNRVALMHIESPK
jgi:hypothetical protein